MSCTRAPQIGCKSVSETIRYAFSFAGKMDAGENLTGSPTVSEATGGLTITNVQITASDLTLDDGEVVEAGQAVLFTASGGTAGTQYTVTLEADTDGTPAQTLRGALAINVESDT